MSEPAFVVVAGPDKGKRLTLHPGDGLLLGRHQDASYQLSDPRISRFHVAVTFRDGRLTLADNGGSGGLIVSGAKVDKHELRPGDSFQVGESILRYEAGGAASAATTLPIHHAAELDAEAVAELATLSGRRLAHFQIGDLLGQGTSSLVFRATDTNDKKEVALKVMQPAFAQDQEEVDRFVRAMKSALPLRHPNLVTVLAAGKSGPYCWAAMEYVEGESLTEVIKRIGAAGMLDWKYAYRVAVHVGRALDYAHGEGIIHRNISPANVMIRSADKTAKLGDLMLAKAMEGALAKQVTKPGEVVGDMNYMSPERVRGTNEGVDGRSDLFSLGATAYALLSGKPPFAGKGVAETVLKIRQAEPLKPSTFQMGIPSAFEGAVLKLLAKRPEDRYQTAGELVKDLERIGKFNGAQA